MGLLKLLKDGKSKFGFSGNTPSTWPGDIKNSALHNTYSVNGTPSVGLTKAPSSLDLDGKTPSQYLNNLPN